MKTKMKVQCDFCKKSFEIKAKATVVGSDPEGFNVIWEYFTCPGCKRKYTFSVKDEEQRRMIAAGKPIEMLKEREKFLRMIYKIE